MHRSFIFKGIQVTIRMAKAHYSKRQRWTEYFTTKPQGQRWQGSKSKSL